MLFKKGVVLGHIISQAKIEVVPAKIEVISNLPIPRPPKEVRSFLGHVGYCRRFIEKFTKIVTPLFKLLMKDVEFKWDCHCHSTFETIKLNFLATPVLRGPNWSIHFHISTNALDIDLGVVLGTKDNQTYYSIYFVTKKPYTYRT